MACSTYFKRVVLWLLETATSFGGKGKLSGYPSKTSNEPHTIPIPFDAANQENLLALRELFDLWDEYKLEPG